MEDNTNPYAIWMDDVIEHIKDRHYEAGPNKATFFNNFNLITTINYLTKKTFYNRDDYFILKQGINDYHGHYYLYVFNLKKVIGTDTYGFPTKHIAVYYSHKQEFKDKFKTITTFPFSFLSYNQCLYRTNYYYYLYSRF